jgi:hypothetical protein
MSASYNLASSLSRILAIAGLGDLLLRPARR